MKIPKISIELIALAKSTGLFRLWHHFTLKATKLLATSYCLGKKTNVVFEYAAKFLSYNKFVVNSYYSK